MDMMKFERLLKKNSRNSILIFIVLSLAGCDSFFNEPEKERFDPREHPLIEEGDTLVFIGSEHVDTLFVWESKFYLSRERYGDEDYEQYVGIMTNGKYFADTVLYLEIEINPGTYSLYYYFQFRKSYDLVASGSTLNKSADTLCMQIGKYELKDLHKADFDNIFHHAKYDEHLFLEVYTAYYSRTYGFVKLIKYTGEEFLLSEESLEMLMDRE